MLNIKKIKEDFIQHFELDKLLEYCKNKAPENIVPQEYRKLSPLFENLNYNFKDVDEESVSLMFSNEKLFFAFTVDNEKHTCVYFLTIYCDEADLSERTSNLDINLVYHVKNNEDFLKLTFTDNRFFRDSFTLEVNEKLEYIIGYTKSSEKKTIENAKQMIENIMNFNQTQLKIDLLNQIIYKTPMTLTPEILETYNLIYDCPFDQKVFKNLHSNFINDEKVDFKKQTFKHKIIK